MFLPFADAMDSGFVMISLIRRHNDSLSLNFFELVFFCEWMDVCWACMHMLDTNFIALSAAMTDKGKGCRRVCAGKLPSYLELNAT